MASINLIRLDTIAEAVCNSLQQAAPTYNPASYKLANVLNMLLPARKMIYHMVSEALILIETISKKV